MSNTGSLQASSRYTLDWRIEGVADLLSKAKETELLSLYLLDGDLKRVAAAPKITSRTFEAGEDRWGHISAFALDKLEAESVIATDCCILRCTFTAPNPHLDLPVNDFAVDLYDNRDYADLVFRLKHTSTSDPPSYLFALKLLLQKRSPYLKTLIASGFEESTSYAYLNLDACPETTLTPAASLVGDGVDFVAFEAVLSRPKSPSPEARRKSNSQSLSSDGEGPSTKKCKIARSDTTEEEAAAQESSGKISQRDEAPSPEADTKVEDDDASAAGSPDVREAAPTAEDDKQDADKVFGSGSEEEEAESDEDARRFQVIDISGRSFATFRSLIYFLHTGMTNFTPSVSDYLVDQHTELEKNEDAEPQPRNNWLIKKSLRKNPPPCNPHALYRLADEHLDDKLRDLAKGFIVRSLTIENVAYEAFCQLSIDYNDFQKDVLKFLLEYWDEVRSTRAMKHALELLEAGQLPGGATVLTKIHEGLMAKK
ncbi:hypothetical protein JCM6882_002241 [Rhodosporidiobolus microsporus]